MLEKLKKIKENKILKFIGNLLYTLLFIIVVLMLLVVVMQRATNNTISVGGVRMFSVATGSMVPVYEVGDILISKEVEPEKMGGFNFGTEDKILRWLHRGDTIYDVIIPEDAEVVLCDAEKGIWRANKIIVTNPQIITDEMVIDLYKKTTLSNKIIAQCLQTLLWKNRIEVSKYIVNDRVNKENVDEFINEFKNYTKKSEKFNYDELGKDSKIIYDLLKRIK